MVDDVINFRIYLGSTSKAMAGREKNLFLKILQKSQKTPVPESVLIKLQASTLELYRERNSGADDFCEFC